MPDIGLEVLLVDDDESFVKVLSLQLSEEYGHRTTVAFSGKEAIGIIERRRSGFDVILLDYMMPEMTGLGFLQWMVEQRNETPVIMLTAAGSEEVAVEAMKLGAYDYVRKEQIDIPHLDLLIKSTYERRQYRIARSLEEEQLREMKLNKEATDRVRDVINAIMPTMNTALAGIGGEVESNGEQLRKQLSGEQRKEFESFMRDISHYHRMMDAAAKGLMGLFQIVYAHHSGMPEIEKIKSQFESSLRDGKDLVESKRP